MVARPPPPPPAGWTGTPTGAGAESRESLAVVAIILGFVILFVIPFLGLAIGNVSLSGSGCVLGLALFILGFVWLFQGRITKRQRFPLPPPVQQNRMGDLQATRINCPSCGGPPKMVDRFGVATCTYCATRFLVQ